MRGRDRSIAFDTCSVRLTALRALDESTALVRRHARARHGSERAAVALEGAKAEALRALVRRYITQVGGSHITRV